MTIATYLALLPAGFVTAMVARDVWSRRRVRRQIRGLSELRETRALPASIRMESGT